MGRCQVRVLCAFAGNERTGLLAAAGIVVPLESLLEVVVDEKTDTEDFLILNLSDQTKQFGLHVGESLEEVVECLVVFLSRHHAVNDLVSEVDVTFDQVHVLDELLVLRRQATHVFHLA